MEAMGWSSASADDEGRTGMRGGEGVEKRWGHLEWRMRRAGSGVVEKDRHLFSAAVVVLLHHRGELRE